jgi:alpha-tubulin suppressor-like RCC1 family protein
LIPTPIIEENFDVIHIVTGRYHSMILKKNGKLFSFGHNGVIKLIIYLL